MYFLSIGTLFLMSFNLQGSSNVPCSSFLTECFQLCSSLLYSFFQFVQPCKVLWFYTFDKEAISFTSPLPLPFSLRCLPVIRCCCLVIRLRVASCHVIIRIASSCFQNLLPYGFPQFRPLSVLSPDTLAHAHGTSKIVFYKWPKNVLGMG